MAKKATAGKASGKTKNFDRLTKAGVIPKGYKRLTSAEQVAIEGLSAGEVKAIIGALDAQVRHFDRIRDRLAAVGKDGVAHYRKMQARRDEISATLKRLGSVGFSPQAGGTGSPFQRSDELWASSPSERQGWYRWHPPAKE